MKNYYHLSIKNIAKISILIFAFLAIIFVDASGQYKRNIVFEIFSEVWCGPCASLTPMHKAWLKNHPDYIPIYYYSYFKVNNVNEMNSPDDYNFRKNFYSVPFYPYARINAVNAPNTSYPGFPTDTNAINAIIDTMTKTTPVKVDIDFTNNGHEGRVKIYVTSEIELENSTLFIYIIEKEHIYERQSNGMTEFNYIMRKSLPKSSGQTFSIKAGETLTFDYDYTLGPNINTDLYATALVQDNISKYIYQVESVFSSFLSSVNEYNSPTDRISIFPNPATDYIEINPLLISHLAMGDSELASLGIYEIKILNTLGQCVFHYTPNLSKGEGVRIDVSHLLPGVYFVRIGCHAEKFVKW